MELKLWIETERGRAVALSRVIGVPSSFVSNWVTGKKGIPLERCTAIERATGGAVTRQDLRPDDWQDHWPELATAIANPTQPATESVAPWSH